LEGLDDALPDGQRRLGDGLVEIQADDPAEATTLGTGTERIVEGEERRGGGTEGVAGSGIGPGCGEAFGGSLWLGGEGNGRVAFAQSEGVLKRLQQTRAVAIRDGDPVLNDADGAGPQTGVPGVVRADDFIPDQNAEVALLAQERKQVLALGIRGNGDGERDQHLLVGEVLESPGSGALGRVRKNLLAGIRIVALGGTSEEQLQVVVDLGQRADGRAGGADVILLLDGDGRWDAVDVIDIRLVHAVEELSDVRGESLHVAALALGVESVESEGGFPGAGRAGDHGELADRDIDIQALQVVLARAPDLDGGLRTGEL
jgi:hypothetical protein